MNTFKEEIKKELANHLSMLNSLRDRDDIEDADEKWLNLVSSKIYNKFYNEYVPFVSEVEEFNETMAKPNNYIPTIGDEKEWMFVYNFILEELEEYKDACEKGDIIGVLDALGDITYVSLGNGTMLHGLKDKIWKAYQEIQRSNMSKACPNKEVAQKTVEIRSQEQGQPCHYEKVGDSYIVYRSSDRKVMKSINYSKPNLTQFFTEEELKN